MQAGDDNMLIGLMGKSGSGKTTIGYLFKELDTKIQVIEIDKIGHESHNDPGVQKKLIEYFPKKVFNEDLSVNRKALSNIVFNDSEMMKKLYDATKDFMERRIDELIKESDITILDYALLPKTKFFDLCDVRILVTTPYLMRSKRVIQRDNISSKKYDEIDSNSIDYDVNQFDYVVENNFDINTLRKAIGDIYEKSIVSSKF